MSKIGIKIRNININKLIQFQKKKFIYDNNEHNEHNKLKHMNLNEKGVIDENIDRDEEWLDKMSNLLARNETERTYKN